MQIILDVDSVVADLIGALLKVVEKEDRSIAIEYDFFENYNNKDDILKTRKAMSNPNFWETLPLITDALEGVEFLRANNHKIIWCTAPYEKCFGWLDSRRKWLNKYFQIKENKDSFIVTEDKYYIQGNCIIDDTISNVDKWEKYNPKGLGYIYRTEFNLRSDRDLVTWDNIINMKIFNERKYLGNLPKYDSILGFS